LHASRSAESTLERERKTPSIGRPAIFAAQVKTKKCATARAITGYTTAPLIDAPKTALI
jgi:hypothetical protein